MWPRELSRRAHSIVVICQNEETQENAQQVLIDDVRYGVEDLVELMKIYSGKNIISKVFTSSLFQRRQEEAEAAINLAIDRLQVRIYFLGQTTTFGGTLKSSALCALLMSTIHK